MSTIWHYEAITFPISVGVLTGGLSVNLDEMMKRLNENAQKGWELVSAFPLISENPLSSTSQIYAIVRRPTTPPPLPPNDEPVTWKL
jgi:hypothetical protein